MYYFSLCFNEKQCLAEVSQKITFLKTHGILNINKGENYFMDFWKYQINSRGIYYLFGI